MRISHSVRALPKLLRSAYEQAVLYGALLVFGTGGLIYTAISPLVGAVLPRDLANRVGQWVMMALFRFFVGLLQLSRIVHCDLSALDRLRGRPLIIVANHPSLLDAVLIVSRLPRVVCIMKAQILDNPFLGGGARLAGYIRADHPMEMMKRAREALASGRQLLVFPEGTRTQTPPLNEFKGNFALMAKQARVPVQTAFIRSDSAYLCRGWPLFRKPEFPIHYRVELGMQFPHDDDSGRLRTRVEDYMRSTLESRPQRAQPPP